MKKCVQGDVEWLEFKLLRDFPQLIHAVFLKGKGFDLGEKGEAQNQGKVLKIFGLESGVKLAQCHKTDLLEVNEAKPGWSLYQNFDGVMTREKGVALMIRHADCQAAIFFDPEAEVIANVHCGWRGSVKNIYFKTIEEMKKRYGTNPQELRVCISPSLGPERAEFKHFLKELPSSFWKYQTMPTYFDFWEISRKQLREMGVLQKHIEIAGICTYLNKEECYSYRRAPGAGHHATVVALNPKTL